MLPSAIRGALYSELRNPHTPIVDAWRCGGIVETDLVDSRNPGVAIYVKSSSGVAVS